MKVIPLKRSQESVYSCISYLVLGTWNRIADVNTLIDVGTDGTIMEEIEHVSTGIGKVPVDQVILTHNHFDHSGGLAAITKKFTPKVYAFNAGPYVTDLLCDGQHIQIGDQDFLVLHCPVHSDDSICLYGEKEGVLFSGDTPIVIRSPGGSYPEGFVNLIKRLSRMQVTAIYQGHDQPIVNKAKEYIHMTLSNITDSNGM